MQKWRLSRVLITLRRSVIKPFKSKFALPTRWQPAPKYISLCTDTWQTTMAFVLSDGLHRGWLLLSSRLHVLWQLHTTLSGFTFVPKIMIIFLQDVLTYETNVSFACSLLARPLRTKQRCVCRYGGKWVKKYTLQSSYKNTWWSYQISNRLQSMCINTDFSNVCASEREIEPTEEKKKRSEFYTGIVNLAFSVFLWDEGKKKAWQWARERKCHYHVRQSFSVRTAL